MTFKKYSAKKDPDSDLDYGRNWGATVDDAGWLQETETITTSMWIITSETEQTPTLIMSTGGQHISPDGKSTSIWFEGGTAGVSYNITNRITTDQGRTEDRTGILTVEEK